MASNKDLLRKNIEHWTAHCKKLEALKKLTDEQKQDLEYRKAMIARWSESVA